MCSVIIILVCNVFSKGMNTLVTSPGWSPPTWQSRFSPLLWFQDLLSLSLSRSPVTFTFNLSSLPPFIHHPSGTCGRGSWRCWPPSSSATAASSPDPLPPANLLFQENWPATLELCIGWADHLLGWVGIRDMCRWRTAPLMWQSTRSLVSSRYPARWKWQQRQWG